MKSDFKPTLLLISGRAIAFAVTFFIPVVLVRIFDQAAFGTYKQVFLVYATLYPVAQLGMAESLFYFIPVDALNSGGYVLNAMIMLAIAGLSCLALLAAKAATIARWLGNPGASPYIMIAGVYLLLMLIATVFEIAMISRKRYLRAAYCYAFSDISRALFLVVPAVLFRSIQALLIGAVIFAVLRLAASVWYLVQEFGRELRIDFGLLRRQIAYCLPFELAVIVEIAQGNLHQYAVSYNFTAAVFAVYSVGCLQLPFVDFVANPACNVMMVRMGEEIHEGRWKSVLHIWHDTTRKLALIFMPLFVLLLVSAREIIRLLFTDRYLGAVPIFMLWSTVVFFSIFQTNGLLRVFAKTRFILFLNIVRLAIIGGSIWWCLRVFHLLGAVVVTLLGTLAFHAIGLMRARGLMQASARQILPWGSLAAIAGVSCAAGLPAWLVKTHVALPLLPLLMVTGTVFVLLYGGMLFAFDLLEEGEKLAITGWLRRPKQVAATEVHGD